MKFSGEENFRAILMGWVGFSYLTYWAVCAPWVLGFIGHSPLQHPVGSSASCTSNKALRHQ